MWNMLFLFVGMAVAGPFGGGGRGPIETVQDEIKEEKSEKELATQERMQQIEAAEGEKAARVVVLQYPDSDVDHTNENLMRNIKTRIARNTAKFYPEIDLYQAGRKEPDPSVRAIDQRAIVPDDAIDRVMTAVDEVASIPWNALSEQDWGLKASALRELAGEIWFVDRVELREPLFLLYAQIGNAAENRNNSAPPFYESVGNKTVNYYWYLAATMAHDEPALMSKLTEQDVNASINNYKTMLDSGQFPPMKLTFAQGGHYDPKEFAAVYQLYINGLEVVITDVKGHYRADPGRVDVYMSRADGHSLSDRIELDKLDDKFYAVADVAKTRMGIDFIDQLMEHPNECTPEVAGDILKYLSIYARLHQQAEIYIVVPKGGSIAPRNLYLWRWDRPSGTLQKVHDDTGGFPVRFAALVGSGITFNGATYVPPDPDEVAQNVAPDAEPPVLVPEPLVLAPAGIPIMYHLRGHYGTLMVTTGMEFSANITENKPWTSLYQTNSNSSEDGHPAFQEEVSANIDPPTTTTSTGTSTSGTTTTTTGDPTKTKVAVDILRERTWQRLVFLGIGVMVGKNAAIGLGPRGYIRTGWYNTPHAVDLTGHLGLTGQVAFGKEPTGRVRPIVDADFWGGALLPYRDSVFTNGKTNKGGNDLKIGKPIVNFGATIAAGLTF